jgi:two-component system, chemotaxis family, protein-glutamate methylesterase/glutaminase
MGIRVLVVDDSVVFRRVVSDAVGSLPGVEVVGMAANGRLAISRLATLRPDLMTLDVEMPEMNGIQVLEQMQSAGLKTGVIVLSAVTVRARELTVRALELGAFDLLTKPEGGTPQENVALLRSRLLPLIQAFRQRVEAGDEMRQGAVPEHRACAPSLAISVPPLVCQPRSISRSGPPLVLIGVSTGGPNALASLIPLLPANFGAPVLIVQHMPPLFTQPLAASLASKSVLHVKEAVGGDCARPGCVYLAPGGRQMKLGRGPVGEALIRVTDAPPENNCRPAVDYLFRSVALQFPGRAIAVILTGMGNDGTQGLRLLKRGGCLAIAQDAASCTVFGMPKAAIQTGLVDLVAPLDGIAAALVRAVAEAQP